MHLEAVANAVIFKFTDEVLSTRFDNKTPGGIIIPLDNTQSQIPRWGYVTHVGPEVEDVKPGEFVLVDKGRWTQGFLVDDERYWKTDDRSILGVTDEAEVVYH